MSVNRVILKGNLGGDPDVRYLPNGTAVANFSLALNERWKDKDGNQQERTEWQRVVAFGKRAEVIGEYVKKGHELYVEGKLRTRDYEKEGIKHYITEVVLDNFDFCGSRNHGDNGDTRAQQQAASYGQQGSNQSRSSGNNPPAHDAPPPGYDDFDDDIPF
jgi:single-strand DNA-binding protein